MADKKADTPEQTPQEKWDAEHYELVEARKAAEKAVFDHRNPTEEVKKAAAKAAAGNGDDEDKDKKAAAKDDDKGAAKGPLAKGTEGYEKGAWPK